MIKIRYFGFLKDILQIEEEEITWDNGNSQDLLNFLRSRNASWSDALAEEYRPNLFHNRNSEKRFTLSIVAQLSALPVSSGGLMKKNRLIIFILNIFRL